MPIQAQCACGRAINVKDDLAGKKIRCPNCKAIVNVPSAAAQPVQQVGAAPVVTPPADAKITVLCTGCQNRLQVGVKFSGKNIRCPKCQAAIKVPELAGAASSVTPPPQAAVAAVAADPSAETGEGDGVAKQKKKKSIKSKQKAFKPKKRKSMVKYIEKGKKGKRGKSEGDDDFEETEGEEEERPGLTRKKGINPLIFVGAGVVVVMFFLGFIFLTETPEEQRDKELTAKLNRVYDDLKAGKRTEEERLTLEDLATYLREETCPWRILGDPVAEAKHAKFNEAQAMWNEVIDEKSKQREARSHSTEYYSFKHHPWLSVSGTHDNLTVSGVVPDDDIRKGASVPNKKVTITITKISESRGTLKAIAQAWIDENALNYPPGIQFDEAKGHKDRMFMSAPDPCIQAGKTIKMYICQPVKGYNLLIKYEGPSKSDIGPKPLTLLITSFMPNMKTLKALVDSQKPARPAPAATPADEAKPEKEEKPDEAPAAEEPKKENGDEDALEEEE